MPWLIHSAARPLPNMTAALGHVGGPKWPPSPLGGEGLANTFYRLPPSGGKLASEARLMRGGKVDPRADEDIRPYNTDNIRSPHPVGAGVLTGPRTGDISPPGEVLSMDGKYPKILGPAGPNPERTFGKRPEYVRRGHELGAAASSARCRSYLSTSRFPSFSPRASRMPCLSGSGCFVPRTMLGRCPIGP